MKPSARIRRLADSARDALARVGLRVDVAWLVPLAAVALDSTYQRRDMLADDDPGAIDSAAVAMVCACVLCWTLSAWLVYAAEVELAQRYEAPGQAA